MTSKATSIASTFNLLKKENRKGFIPYITAGVPNLEATRELLQTLQTAGADVIELGVPFSDPVADGPVNQKASEIALKGGTNLQKVLALIKDMRQKKTLTVPVVLFTYINPIFRMGFETFGKAAQDAGVDGVLIVDLPLEESDEPYKIFESHNLTPIYLTSPTTTVERLKKINDRSTGFVYYVSRLGVTGAQSTVSHTLGTEIKRLRESVKNPIAVGFGVSTPSQAKSVGQLADAVVVGSALMTIILENLDNKEKAKTLVSSFVKDCVLALKA